MDMVIMTLTVKKVSIIKLVRLYLHGPILPKNHEMTDYLLEKACERKGIPFEPKELDNTEEEAAKSVLIERAKGNKH